MAKKYAASMPPDLDLSDGYTVRLTALDPTTGSLVSGVNVSALGMQILLLGGTTGADLAVGPFMFVPGPGA